MSLIADILDHNNTFVQNKEYEPFRTDRFPDKKLVVLSCMDTRLVELLPRAMNFRQGDAKLIKNAGAIVSHPFGSVMRSILVAVYELGAAEVAIVGHHECGMTGLNAGRVLAKARDRGVPEAVLATLRHHPLLPAEVPVHGLIIHPLTGKLDLLADGYAWRRG